VGTRSGSQRIVNNTINSGVLSLKSPMVTTEDGSTAFSLQDAGGTFYLEVGREGKRYNEMLTLDETNAKSTVENLREEFGDNIDPKLAEAVIRKVNRWTRENPGTMDDLMETTSDQGIRFWGVDPSEHGEEYFIALNLMSQKSSSKTWILSRDLISRIMFYT
jgi:hypothetical protein